MTILPVCGIVPTGNRAPAFRDTLASLAEQGVLPAELVVIDASEDHKTRQLVKDFVGQLGARVSALWVAAQCRGAAPQRNQGIGLANQPFVWFFDDDILFKQGCVNRLWRAISTDPKIGGVSAMIVNQHYQSPGLASRTVFRLLNGKNEHSFAGRLLGPAVNLLPEDREDLPEVVPVDWLNTTCTIYRREALPTPAFDSVFTGYSMMEDVTLSLRVGRQWRLANARTARIFHDSQPGAHKADVRAMAKMELVNRHYVMKEILGRGRFRDYARLFLWECFQLASCAAGSQSRKALPAVCRGKLNALRQLNRTYRGRQQTDQ